jgi:hypothetical protein
MFRVFSEVTIVDHHDIIADVSFGPLVIKSTVGHICAMIEFGLCLLGALEHDLSALNNIAADLSLPSDLLIWGRNRELALRQFLPEVRDRLLNLEFDLNVEQNFDYEYADDECYTENKIREYWQSFFC